MHFAQHIIISWFAAEASGIDNLTEKRMVTFAGVLPDIDVLPYAAGIGYNWLYGGMPFSAAMQKAFDDIHLPVHHHYTHGIGFIVITFFLALFICRISKSCINNIKVPLLSAGMVLLHCLCDVLASGPNWPVYPLWPFSDISWGYSWSWTLADWENIVILLVCLAAARQYGVYKGRTVVEVFSPRADRWFVNLIRGTSMNNVKKVFISADELEKDSWEFAHDIYSKEGFFDVIIGITRGGAQISIYMHEAFCVLSGRKPKYKVVEAAAYEGVYKPGSLQIENLEWVYNIVNEGDRILLIDDIFDRGVTLKETKEAILNRMKSKNISLKIAALYYKPANTKVEISPDFHFKTFEENEWLFLPHELQGLDKHELIAKGFKWL